MRESIGHRPLRGRCPAPSSTSNTTYPAGHGYRWPSNAFATIISLHLQRELRSFEETPSMQLNKRNWSQAKSAGFLVAFLVALLCQSVYSLVHHVTISFFMVFCSSPAVRDVAEQCCGASERCEQTNIARATEWPVNKAGNTGQDGAPGVINSLTYP